jgi:hypothetical protein
VARFKTFFNGAALLPGDLNAIEDDYEFTFSTYKDIIERMGAGVTSPAAGTYLMATSGGGTLTPVPNAAQGYVFYFDPADRTANTRGNKYRVRGQVIVNAVAPTTNWTIGLYPVATWGGASGSSPTVATLGTVVAGSTIAFNAPAANSQNQGNSGDFTAPAAGYYVLAVVNSGAAAVGSFVSVFATLQFRQV